MTHNDYHPVSCDMHSQLELAIMHRTKLSLSWYPAECLQTETVLPVDIQTKNKQEFLYVKTDDNKIREIRLDKIKSMSPA